VQDLAAPELALITAADGFRRPDLPVIGEREDYTQHARATITGNESLQSYQARCGTATTFGLAIGKCGGGLMETRPALLLTLALREPSMESTALELWDKLYNPTAYLVGRSDDLTIRHYLDLMDQVYGPQADLATIMMRLYWRRSSRPLRVAAPSSA
jgi:hypothetical protein